MSEPSNTEAENRADPVTYHKIGRATCPNGHGRKAYVARVEVEDLRCPTCGAVCHPAHEEEG
jgi:hypothetical protein